MKNSEIGPPDFDFKITHRNWLSAFSELHVLLIYAEPGEVVCVTGPSRVGKSTLVREVMRAVCGEDNFAKTGKMPFVRVSAANTAQHGTFSTRAFAVRLLHAIDHPIFSEQTDSARQRIDLKREGDIRLILERSLVHRGTRYVVIDEGQHVIFSKNAGVAPHAILDSWKCLAEDSGVVLVIVGAYPILRILQNSPHLLGRKSQVHFPRYYLSESDADEFIKILNVYDEVVLPQKNTVTLSDHAEILYGGSLGCFGLLRGWLRRAHAFASQHEKYSFRRILELTAFSDGELKKLKDEISEGEHLLRSTLGERDELASDDFIVRNLGVASEVRKGKTKPFQRNPKRYVMGNRLGGDNDG